jgi:hypothetical protein
VTFGRVMRIAVLAGMAVNFRKTVAGRLRLLCSSG